MKKSGGFIPGIRPGKPTVEYLTKILNYIIFIGACGLDSGSDCSDHSLMDGLEQKYPLVVLL